jgi:5-methyltetrahydropteroyltriglutamate--homocysteine methyltransferase
MAQLPHGRPPFRADHVGSLLRPQDLRQAFRRHASGELDETDFARLQDRCIRDAVTLQEQVFLHGVTKATGKITLPAPSTMHFYRCTDYADRSIYPDHVSFFTDLATIFQQEIAELVKAGCRYIQLDEVAVALLCDPGIREQVAQRGSDPDALVDLYIKSINDAVANCPRDVVVGVHMCRGNFKGHYLGAGGYEKVAERFFAETKVNHFLLEYDSPRAGDFGPLRFVPKGKGVVLGLISTKTPVLENKDALKRRIDDASRSIDFERLAIGPQCGFASTVAGNPLTEADERAKLGLAVQIAGEIWTQM